MTYLAYDPFVLGTFNVQSFLVWDGSLYVWPNSMGSHAACPVLSFRVAGLNVQSFWFGKAPSTSAAALQDSMFNVQSFRFWSAGLNVQSFWFEMVPSMCATILQDNMLNVQSFRFWIARPMSSPLFLHRPLIVHSFWFGMAPSGSATNLQDSTLNVQSFRFWTSHSMTTPFG